MGAQPSARAFAHPRIEAHTMSGSTPFMTGADIQDDAARQAHALLLWLANGLLDAGELDEKNGRGEASMTGTTGRLMSDALEGIATLVALSDFGSQLREFEQERPREA